MNFHMATTKLGIILLTIAALELRCCICARLNEVMYSFKYAVEAARAGVYTHHSEERRGDLVRGSYSLVEPDGRIRVVEYQVDGARGFRAVVKHRRPPVPPPVGHLQFPNYYRRPIFLSKPVSYITNELVHAQKSYPNFST